MKFGFIGLGNMGGAILRGMRNSEKFADAEIFGFDPVIRDAQAVYCESAAAVCEKADAVICAVKPQVIEDVLKSVAEKLAGKLLISIAAGKTIEFLSGCVGESTHVVRVMPNINATVLSATSAFCAGEGATEEEKEAVRDIFATIGTVTELEEKHFSTFSAVASCSPAFTYMYIDALARAAVRAGMPRAQAQSIAASSVLGSAKMVMDSGKHPMELCDMVCSPGGTTIEGVMALRELGFENAVHEAVRAAIDKDKKL